MKMKVISILKLSPFILAIAGIAVFFVWLGGEGPRLNFRLPGMDNSPAEGGDGESMQSGAGTLLLFDGVASGLTEAWPGFRGGNFDGISRDDTPLVSVWGEDFPKVLWSIDLGEGYAGPAVLNGRVYLVDYDMQARADAIRCFSLDDGREIWRHSYPVMIKRNHGMSRTVPAITDEYLLSIGPKCHVRCLDAVTGRLVWAKDLVREYKAVVPLWYAGQCPLIDNGKAIIAPGGKALMIAVDCATGRTVWETPNPKGWEMTHSSIMPMEFSGRRMYVYCASGGVVGVSADDGAILWETEAWKLRTNVPSPVIVGDGLIFLSAGYNKGSMMLKLETEQGQILAEPLWSLAADVFGSDQQTPIFYNGYIYGVRPDRKLACLDPGGKTVWTSEAGTNFGLGPYTIAKGMIYLMDDNGMLTLAEATPAGYTQLGRAKVLTGHDSWGPMAIVSGRLLVRDFTRMVCLEIGEH